MTMRGMTALAVSADAAALATQAADWMAGILRSRPGPVAVALSGGSTPKLLFQTLAKMPFLDRMPWDRVHWFWGDERFVPAADPRNNASMAAAAMLTPAAVPADLIHAIPTEGMTPEQAAERYQATLQAFYGAATLDPARPLFDIVLLGLGTNGHTASLFPGMPVLHERNAWAAAVTPENEPTRITLTYPALESCRHAAFLVAGADKRAVLHDVRSGGSDLPAAQYHPQGELRWFADQAAAG